MEKCQFCGRDAALLAFTLLPVVMLGVNAAASSLLFGKKTKVKHEDILPFLLYFYYLGIIMWRKDAGNLDTVLIFVGIIALSFNDALKDANNYKLKHKIAVFVCIAAQVTVLAIYYKQYGTYLFPEFDGLEDYASKEARNFCLTFAPYVIKNIIFISIFSTDFTVLNYARMKIRRNFFKENRIKFYIFVGIVKAVKMSILWATLKLFIVPDKDVIKPIIEKYTCDYPNIYLVMRTENKGERKTDTFLEMLVILATVSTSLLWPEENILETKDPESTTEREPESRKLKEDV